MNFYICNIICAIVALYVYITFRISITSYLRINKNSKTFIKKNKKGCANYWLYKKIHSEIGLGHIYTLNIFLLILTPTYFCLAICLGWAIFFFMPIAICNALLCVAQIPAIIFSDMYWNLENYKKKFVIFERNKGLRGFHSSFYAILGILGLLTFAIYNVYLAI